MSKIIPDIRIKYAWLLANGASVVMNEKWGDGTPLRSNDEYVAIVEKYRQWWAPHNDKVLHGVCDIFDLEFRQNIIDVNVAPWFNAISDPMVIGPAFKSEDDLVNTLTHELLHRLLTDNTSTDYEHDFVTDWKNMFGDEHTKTTLVHIPVHAGMKKLYLDVIHRPDLLALDIEDMRSNPDYAKAWGYIEAHDYNDIINRLRRKD
jgi:hypothetical protein